MAAADDFLDPSGEVLDGRLVAMLLGGILCLGMALGLELYPYFSGRLAPARLQVNEQRAGEAPPVPAQEPQGPLTFGELMQILSPRRADPAAARFIRAFEATASLRDLYARFASGPQDRPALDFVIALQHAPDFGDLVREQAKAPDFRKMASVVTRHPEISRLLHEMRRPGAPEAPPLPEFAPADTDADTFGAEESGRLSPSGPVHAPGRPLDAPPDR